MWAPSGDQLGQSSSARWLVTSCTLPSVFMSQMSRWPSRRSLTKAIRAGIGAKGAAVSRQPASAAPPATSVTVNGSKDFIDPLLVSRPDETTPLLREIHLGRLCRAGRLELEVRAWSLAQDLRREELREASDVGVVAVHRVVVDLARDGDTVFGPL